MESLIRSARLGPERRRLSDARADVGSREGPAAESRGTPPGYTSPAALDTLKNEIEQRVRAELADHYRQLEQADWERARSRGHEQGLNDGLAEGRAKAAAESAQARAELIQQVRGTLDVLRQTHEVALAHLESRIGEVAFAAVCRLLSRAALSQSFVLGLVKETCALVRAETVATARLHPRDIQLLQALMNGQELLLQPLTLKVIPDEALELGGCIIETEAGHFDGGLEGQLRRLHAVLNEAMPVDDGTIGRK
jgi:flagellar assembly protein FliH